MNETLTVAGAVVSTVGALVGAVRWLGTKLSDAYEARIAACEQGIRDCETDRIDLRKQLIESLKSHLKS